MASQHQGAGTIDAHVSDEQRRVRYAEAVDRLARFFPQFATDDVKTLYLKRMIDERRHPDDVDQAVDRIVSSLNSKTFPAWAAIEERLRDIAQKRAWTPLVDVEEMPSDEMTPEQRAVEIECIRAERALSFPKRKTPAEPFPNVARAARGERRIPQAQTPKPLPPLTPEDIRLIKTIEDTWKAKKRGRSEPVTSFPAPPEEDF